MTAIASKAATKLVQKHMAQYAPTDPYYDEIPDPQTGKIKKKKRGVPPGLSKRDERALKKIRKRAHYLDKGMNLCGFRVGWTFFIGIIPGLGDIVNATLNYTLVVRPATKLDLPKDLTTKMLANNAVSAGIGLVPLIGDVALAAWKANSRNANLLEVYLTIRGQEYLAQLHGEPSMIHPGETNEHGARHEDVRSHFKAGAGMEGSVGRQAPVVVGDQAPVVAGKKTRGAH